MASVLSPFTGAVNLSHEFDSPRQNVRFVPTGSGGGRALSAAKHSGAGLGSLVCQYLAELDGIGHEPGNPAGAYNRFAWTPQDRALRSWFTGHCEDLGLVTEQDTAGNLWAWWLPQPIGSPAEIPAGSAVTTGSHLDSVSGGGAFDGPLGVISALLAVGELRSKGFVPRKPIGVVCFSDEEGARFGRACVGSRVLTGTYVAGEALGFRDADGLSLAEALSAGGVAVDAYGPQPQLLERIGSHVELHVEQGYALAPAQVALGVASGIWPHGRWRVGFVGEANHAGTTPLAMRRDPMIALARFILDVRRAAQDHDAVATVGRVLVVPNGVNVIASHADAWLDIRAHGDDAVDAVLAELAGYGPALESRTPATHFDAMVADRLDAACCEHAGVEPLRLPTAAGHDAGILTNAGVRTGMIFVRSVNGASHTPSERAEMSDCAAGVEALAGYLEDSAR